ncbi:DNA methyltransferase [Spirochaetota bacterium]|nr:DNA methyltransferase [Spirochaetota bacterium]
MLQKTIKNRTVFCRDNLEILRNIDDKTIDLIYLDPPFNKKREFHAPLGTKAEGASFKDTWDDEDIKKGYLTLIADLYPNLYKYLLGVDIVGSRSHRNYLVYMAQRVIEMKRILKNTGSIYLHCDYTMSHYLKLLMDCIFGHKNLRNEIIWCYHGPGSPDMRQFNRKSDNIFWYSIGETWTFNKEAIRVPFKDPKQSLRKRMAPSHSFTSAEIKEYREKGKIPENWWEIRIAARSPKEYVGYPTQKPLALMERIIKASSRKGDVVLDPFCGCATTCVAAENLGRQWVGIDVSKRAYDLVKTRLESAIKGTDEHGNQDLINYQKAIVYREDIPDRTDIKDRRLSYRTAKIEIKHILYEEQNASCNGCRTQFEYRHFEIDHIVPTTKGGGDTIENLQLLCHHCNRIKGNKDMEHLNMRLQELNIIKNN